MRNKFEFYTDGVTNSFVGTPDYMAPEIFLQKNHEHDKTVDWWSLVFLF